MVEGQLPAEALEPSEVLGELSLQARDDAEGRQVLRVAPVAELHEAAPHIREVTAERVVDVVGAEGDSLVSRVQRVGGQLLGRLPVRVARLEEGLRVLAEGEVS